MLFRSPYLASWTAGRRTLAARYRERLSGAAGIDVLPECDPGHVYHLFVVRAASRDNLQDTLASLGIETLVHYPVSLDEQQAFHADRPDRCPEARAACATVLSLPLHPGMTAEDVDYVAAALSAR